MRVGRWHVNPIDAMLAVLLPVTAFGLYIEFFGPPTSAEVIAAAMHGDLKEVYERVDEEFDFLARDEYGRTLLHAAAERGDLRLVMRIMTSGGRESVHALDYSGNTPMHRAVDAGQPRALRALLANGGDPNFVQPNGESLLDFAIRNGGNQHMAAVVLRAGAKVSNKPIQNDPMIVYLMNRGWIDLLRLMLQAGLSPELPPGSRSDPPLAIAIHRRDPEAVRLLLEFGADVNARWKCRWVKSIGNPPRHGGRGGTPRGVAPVPFAERWRLELVKPSVRGGRGGPSLGLFAPARAPVEARRTVELAGLSGRSGRDGRGGSRRFNNNLPRPFRESNYIPKRCYVLPFDYALVYERFTFTRRYGTASEFLECGAPTELIPRLMTMAMRHL